MYDLIGIWTLGTQNGEAREMAGQGGKGNLRCVITYPTSYNLGNEALIRNISLRSMGLSFINSAWYSIIVSHACIEALRQVVF